MVWVDVKLRKAVHIFGWVFFLDFASSSTRTPHGDALYVQGGGRNRIDIDPVGVQLNGARGLHS